VNSDPPLRPVFWGALAFAAGISAGAGLEVRPLWTVLGGASAFGAGALLSEPRNRIRAVCFALGWAALGCGVVRARRLAREAPFPAGEVRLLGQVVSFPSSARGSDGRPRKRFRLKVGRVLGRERASHSSTLWVNAPSAPLAYGDVLELEGSILPPGRADFPGGWDDGGFLSVHGLSGRLFVRDPPQSRLLGPGPSSFFLRQADSLKRSIEEQVRRVVPNPESALVLALLLGEQDEIPFSVRDGFAKSGTAHLLAISGGNVALVVFVLTAALGAGGAVEFYPAGGGRGDVEGAERGAVCEGAQATEAHQCGVGELF
jgi:competence protein ComEC